ncbi:nitroreductase/ferredoxin-like protein FixX [Methanohalophilus levihalophilus]|uniref:nitroreductase family protein n=1 Tax=Methanohalophilus levihalophilus TaxID=1431282 RepID=UPI001AE5A0A5|nr:nitroreductase family protein [Methanohalophilus levihalophilus]MBP2029506.1 nitroreductase/ferredoxin-like protein FixX [Methanohalophilus levihalophilus]
MKVISIDSEACTSCGTCVDVCPFGLIVSVDDSSVPFMPDEVGDFCSECGHCEVCCPEGAISTEFKLPRAGISGSASSAISPEQLGNYMLHRRSVRNYSDKIVEKDKIESILDVVRYSPSGMNNQPVHWTIIHDPAKVRKLVSLTIDWMREIAESEEEHPLKMIVSELISSYEMGGDPICRGAPHLAIAHASSKNPMAYTDSIIALSWFELLAPSFDLGACWAGFLQIAATSYQPLIDELDLPEGHAVQHAMMFGYPEYKVHRIPGRQPLRINWK